MSQFIYYQKQAWATLRKKVAFVTTVVVTMGTTLGVLLCVLTLGHLLLIKPLPYPEQDRLYRVNHNLYDQKENLNASAFSYPGLIHLYKNQGVFEKTALLYYGEEVLASMPLQPKLGVGYVTPEWFSLLGAQTVLGRVFQATEALDKNNPVVVLTYKAWQEEFAGATNILEQSVSLRDITYKIVGVLNKDFIEPKIAGSGLETGIWLPWDYNPVRKWAGEHWGNINDGYNFIGRMKPSISTSQAAQILTPLINDTWQEEVVDVPFFKGWSISMGVVSVKDVIIGDSRRMILILSAGVLGLVIIAFTNIANLFLSRTAEQQRQLAIYSALGAKKSHIFRTLFAESSNLMAIAMLLALVIASLGFNLMQDQFAGFIPRLPELQMNIVTVGTGVIIAFLFALLFTLFSARTINHHMLNSQLQSSGKGSGLQVSKKFRQVLVVSQITIATALVFVSLNLFSGAIKAIQQPLGFQISNMATIALSLSTAEVPPEEELSSMIATVHQNILALPQIKSVSQSASPLQDFRSIIAIDKKTNTTYTPGGKVVNANYFEQINQPLLSGRFFKPDEIRDGAQNILVNDVFAAELSESGEVLGRQLELPLGPHTIIGIVKSVRLPGRAEPISNRLYRPANNNYSQINLALEPNHSVKREQIVAAIREASNRLALFYLQVLPQQKDKQLFVQYATATTTSTLAIVTLFLASVGLYGIISYGTQMRRFEIGTRMAIGAKRSNLVSLIIRDNARIIGIGFVLSIFLLGVGYLTYGDSLAEYVNTSFVPVLVITLVSIGALALFACYWPLRRYINNPAIHILKGDD